MSIETVTDHWAYPRYRATGIGERLRQTRHAAGLALLDVAGLMWETVPLTVSELSRIERGQVIPSPEQGRALTAWMSSQDRLQIAQGIAIPDAAVDHYIATPTPPRGTHPDTSRKAAMSVDRDNARAIHRWIIEQLTDHPDGLTHEQMWTLHFPADPKSSQSGLRTRVSELVRGGVVQDSGRTRTMSTGRQAIVWTLTTQGGTDA